MSILCKLTHTSYIPGFSEVTCLFVDSIVDIFVFIECNSKNKGNS